MKKAVIIPKEYLITAQHWLFEDGYCWCTRFKNIIPEFNKNYDEICFNISVKKAMEYCHTDFYKNRNYQIIKFEDFFKNKFRKNKLSRLL